MRSLSVFVAAVICLTAWSTPPVFGQNRGVASAHVGTAQPASTTTIPITRLACTIMRQVSITIIPITRPVCTIVRRSIL